MPPREISRTQRGGLPYAAIVAWACACVVGGLVPNGAAAAADGRVYELVTPAAPVAATIEQVRVISADGTRVAYVSIGTLPGAPAGDVLGNTVAVRGPNGWVGYPVGVPYSVGSFTLSTLLAAVPVAFGPDLGTSLWKGNIALEDGPGSEEEAGLYRRAADGTVTPLFMGGEFVASSDDQERVVFNSEKHLLPADAGRTSGSSIYELDGSSLSLVDQGEGGAPLSECGSQVGEPDGVSETTERIFFVNPGRYEPCSTPSRVYLREGGRTVEVSASQCTRPDCDAPQPVSFAGATPSGSYVYLSTTQQLTNSDTDESRDLYRYDVADGELVEVSAGPDAATGEVEEGSVYPAADGSRVYFDARGSLVPGDGAGSGENLYMADASGLHFLAATGVSGENFEISRDGQRALLATPLHLAPGDTDERTDVYLYDAASRTFTWISQGDGGNGEFNAQIFSPIESFVIGLQPEDRALSADGSRAFFSTKEPLLPEDGDEALDVYEFAEGSLRLVTPGAGEEAAEFTGVSADGSTVLFRTREALVPSDQDGGEADIYAARLGGGFPAPPAPPPCSEACAPPAPTPSPSSRSPRSTGPSPKPGMQRLRLKSISARAAGLLAAGRPARIVVYAPAPGRIAARATTAAGGAAAAGVAGAVRPGNVSIWLRGTARGRRALRRGGVLALRLEIREGDLRLTRRVRLRPASGSGRGS